ncbi:RNA-binding protein [Trypanosoma theileri]|uniref:RNA-binding protein n=1 Tax=Trypanosoma theileri TaxID=67003 RepID=A0A1X0P281_9TRYP|nr:RNA-binding protein [Trypanosoma theileri]ORC90961.1 RNA-binding protein [Trypanosoma theileri]
MSEPPRLQGRMPSQQHEMPPMPPGFKLPPGVGMAPMPPGMKRPPGGIPMPPNMPGGAPLPPPTAHHHHQHQHQQHQYQHQQHHQHQYQHHDHHYHHQQQQQMQGGAPPAPIPGSYYPTPPSHLAQRSVDGREEKYPQPPGMLQGGNDMYSSRNDRRMMMPPGPDARGYMPSAAAPPYHHGHYGPPMGHDSDRRGGASHHRSRRDDEVRQPTNTVWVGNLDPYEHTEEVLRQEFREFGKVIRIAKVPEQSYCFVHFRHVEEARNAVETLSARGTLGRARFNYGKMFEYSQDEMDVPHENNNHRPPRRGREEERQENEERRRRPRREEERMEPTNVLWIGDLPPTVSSEELNENFKVFGNITTISRLDNRNMAFIHFENVESCTQALDLMRGQTIGGARVVLNYGRAQRSPAVGEGGGNTDGIPPNETPTNVVYLGQFASDVTEEDIEELFEPFEGFINCKFIQSSGIAFGHFDTIDHARDARIALNNALLKGAPVRISFGKSNHTMTMADRMRRGRHIPLGADTANTAASVGGMGGAISPLPAGSTLASTGGALVAGPGIASTADNGAMVALPAMGVMVGTAAVPQAPTYFTRERPVPEMTLEARLQSLLGSTYNCCGEAEKSLSPSVIQTICDLIDDCVDEESEKRLDEAIFLYTPLNAAHVFGILAKRMYDYFNDDPYKKLYILYAATRVLLGAKTDYLFFTKASINAYLMTLFVASEGQTPAGNDMITSIIENVRRHTFIERQKLDADFIEIFREQLDEILKRVKVDQDLVSLLSKKRRK